MQRKWIAIIGIMMLFVAGCGGSESPDVATQVDEQATSAPASSEPATTTPTTEPTTTTTEAAIIITATTAAEDASTDDVAADAETGPADITPVVASEIDFENSDVVLWFWAPW